MVFTYRHFAPSYHHRETGFAVDHREGTHLYHQHPHGKVSTSQFANRQARASLSKPRGPLWFLMCTMGSFNLVQLFESVLESSWLKVNHTIMAFQ